MTTLRGSRGTNSYSGGGGGAGAAGRARASASRVGPVTGGPPSGLLARSRRRTAEVIARRVPARPDGPHVRARAVRRAAAVEEGAPLRRRVRLPVTAEDLRDGHLARPDVLIAEGELLRDRAPELRVRLGVRRPPGRDVVAGEAVVGALGLP